jgi:hypothetical protein
MTRSAKGLFHLGSLSKCKNYCPVSHLNSTSPCARPRLPSLRGGKRDNPSCALAEEALRKELPQKKKSSYLRFAEKALRKERPHRPVDQAAAEELPAPRGALPAEIAPRDPALGVVLLPVINLLGEMTRFKHFQSYTEQQGKPTKLKMFFHKMELKMEQLRA